MSQNQALPAAFIFDCDGTLVDSMGAWLDVQPRLLASFGVEGLTPDDFAEFEALSVENECAAYHDKWGVGEPGGRDIFERLLGMLEQAYAEDVPARPGAPAFLERVHAAGIPCTVATSTPAHLVQAALEHTGLAPYLEGITTTEEAGASKEHPDVYNLALARLAEAHGLGEVDRRRVWVFEDALFGLLSAGAAGYRRVGIHDPAGRFTLEQVGANSEIFITAYEDDLLDRVLAFRSEEA